MEILFNLPVVLKEGILLVRSGDVEGLKSWAEDDRGFMHLAVLLSGFLVVLQAARAIAL